MDYGLSQQQTTKIVKDMALCRTGAPQGDCSCIISDQPLSSVVKKNIFSLPDFIFFAYLFNLNGKDQ